MYGSWDIRLITRLFI